MKRKILFLTFIYIFTGTTFLTPFMAIKGASKLLGLIIFGVLTVAYLAIIVIWILNLRKNK